MRVLSLIFSFLVTVSLAAVTLAYMPGYVGQQRIYVHGHQGSPPDHAPYHNGTNSTDTALTAPANRDPYLQRYYSQSEGWTYYALPSFSSGRKSSHE